MLAYASVLVEIGDLYDAEREVLTVLGESPHKLEALSLLAKIKHMRGELSQAIACWAEIYAHDPLSGGTFSQLRSLLRLANDPEVGAADYMALRSRPSTPAPAARIEVEEAFSLFLTGLRKEARALCQAIAHRYRNTDREAYKLAVMADAWMADLEEQLEEAVQILERLGEERTFARDLDRVLALEQLYERIGKPRMIESAVHICRYVERHHGGIGIISKLPGLLRRLGREEEARAAETHYLDSFRQRMHRPTPAEVVRVASERYIPLWRLAKLRFNHVEGDFDRRAQGIADALTGDKFAARESFARSDEVLDAAYLGDLSLMSGDADQTVDRYIGVLKRALSFEQIAGWLLDYHLESPDARIAGFFRQAEVLARVTGMLRRSLELAPFRPSTWTRLATLLQIEGGRETEVIECLERAEAHRHAHERKIRPIGRVLSAAVYHFIEHKKGLVHEIWAGREPTAPGQGGSLPPEMIMGNLSEQMRQSVQSIFLSVREYAQNKFPHVTADLSDYRYTYKVTKEDERSHGVSAGLPTAVAFLSVFLQTPVPQDTALTGVLVTEAHDVLTVREVGDSAQKVKAAYNRNLGRIILPESNRAEINESPCLPRAVVEEIVRFVPDLDAAVRIVFGSDAFTAGASEAKRADLVERRGLFGSA